MDGQRVGRSRQRRENGIKHQEKGHSQLLTTINSEKNNII